MNTVYKCLICSLTAVATLLSLPTSAAESLGKPVAPSSAAAQKPAWLSDLSFSIKESYDDNVFLSGVPHNALPSFTVPPGSVAAVENQSSWVTTVSPKIGLNFAPLFESKNLETLSLAYAPDFLVYSDEPTESYNAHRFVTAVKGKTSQFSLNLDNAFTYINGSETGPTFPGAFCSAYGTAGIRERREQFQDRAKIAFRYDAGRWFVRPTAALLYYDLMTEHINSVGYQNYVDRYDVNGGVDLGYKVTAPLALTLGYRYGHQYQEALSFSPYQSPSDYHRVLFGFEGRPLKWLKVEFQMGPDFRTYPEDTASHIAPITDKTPVLYYGEATVSADFTAKDTLSFKYKQYQWVSSTGRVPYFDSTYDLAYRRKLTDSLTLDLGARFGSMDYNTGNLPTCKRDDLQYTLSIGLGYNLSKHIAVNASYAADLGRNAQDNIVGPENREFTRNVVSLGTVIKF